MDWTLCKRPKAAGGNGGWGGAGSANESERGERVGTPRIALACAAGQARSDVFVCVVCMYVLNERLYLSYAKIWGLN